MRYVIAYRTSRIIYCYLLPTKNHHTNTSEYSLKCASMNRVIVGAWCHWILEHIEEHLIGTHLSLARALSGSTTTHVSKGLLYRVAPGRSICETTSAGVCWSNHSFGVSPCIYIQQKLHLQKASSFESNWFIHESLASGCKIFANAAAWSEHIRKGRAMRRQTFNYDTCYGGYVNESDHFVVVVFRVVYVRWLLSGAK